MPKNETAKINQILQCWPPATVGLTAWLDQTGVDGTQQRRYMRAGWLEAIGPGALKRGGESLDWLGGLYAVQHQARLNIHVGGRTALGLQGQAHYLELNQRIVQLFAPLGVNLPLWFRNHDWGVRPELHRTDFLPPDVALVDVERGAFSVKVSSGARALMECLYLAPDHFDLVEAYQIMEGLTTLRPVTVQRLLEQCRSVKVKRLFLFMAERAGHAWFKHLDITPARVDMGSGKRSLTHGGGVYVPKYQITVPRELATPKELVGA